MMKYPFSDKQKFMKIYQIGSFTFSLILSIVFTAELSHKKIENSSLTATPVAWVFFLTMVSTYILGMFSIVKAHQTLSKPGFSLAER